MSRIVEETIYTIDELSPDVRERVIDRQREDDFSARCALEWELDAIKEDLKDTYGISGEIRHDLSYSQGDGAVIIADNIDWRKVVENCRPGNRTNNRLIWLLENHVSWRMWHTGHYCHEFSFAFDYDFYGVQRNATRCTNLVDGFFYGANSDFKEWMRVKSKEVKRRLYATYEDATSDAVVMENIRANNMEFYRDGRVY